MANRFTELAFTDAVKAAQATHGSRGAYARREGGLTTNDALGPDEAAFIDMRDSFYMATVGATGWPYVQHRGGPRGFLKVLDARTIGFADFRGNRQYVTLGNLAGNDRASLILMDYANRARLKILGRVAPIGPEAPDVLAALALPGYDARVERGLLVRIAAFDWNCPQHITPRYTLDEVDRAVAPLRARIAELEARLAQAGRTGGAATASDPADPGP